MCVDPPFILVSSLSHRQQHKPPRQTRTASILLDMKSQADSRRGLQSTTPPLLTSVHMGLLRTRNVDPPPAVVIGRDVWRAIDEAEDSAEKFCSKCVPECQEEVLMGYLKQSALVLTPEA